MGDARWETLWAVFHEAAGLVGDARIAYLNDACDGNAALRDDIEALLATHRASGPLDDAPALAQLAADVLDPAALIGTHVGRYTIVSVIGEGGMGTVYAAEQREPVRRVVALKIVKPGMDSREVVARFESERQALALMTHPGIAAVLDCGATDDGRLFFAMELVDGVSITTFCDRESMSIRQRLETLAAVCDAVQHAHRKGIIHRDLKPSNVLVGSVEGTRVPKVIDFGIAKATSQPLTERTLHTGFGRPLGTPEYMSPEQAAGSPDVDTQSDVYSLGVMLYELLCEALPFDFSGKSYDQVLSETKRRDAQSPSRMYASLGAAREGIARARGTDPETLGRTLSGELDWIAVRAVQYDRGLRYGTATDLAADIRRYLANEPLDAGPPSTGYRLRKLVQRHRPAVVGTAAVAVSLLAGVVVSVWLALVAAGDREVAIRAQDEAEVARDEARVEAETAQVINDLLIETLGSPDPESGTWSPGEARNVKVVDVLARAASESAATFADRPHLEASVRAVVGRTFLRLGLFDEAEAELRLAVTIYTTALGDGDEATLAAQNDLAATVSRQGRRPEAIELYRSTLEGRRRVLGDSHTDSLATMANLANVLVQHGQIDDAEPLLEDVLRLGRRVANADDANILQAMTGLAFIRNRSGDYAGAAELYGEVLDARTTELGGDHPATLTAIGNLAVALQRAGRLTEAAERYDDAIERMGRVHGPRHATTLNAMSNLGSLLRLRGDLTGAAEMLRGVAVANQDTLGRDHRALLPPG